MARIGRPPKADKVTFSCKQCGNEWEQYAWQKDCRDYCSRKCFYKSRIGKGKPLVTPKERKCRNCGKVFLVGGAGNRPKYAKYCSRSCARGAIWGEAQHSDARMMSKDECIWFAAILDGEGCIGWPRRNILHSVYLTVTNTHKGLIDRIAKITGTGRVKVKRPKERRHSKAWVWTCYGQNSQSLIRQALPWLLVKRKAAETALGMNGAKEPPWTQRSKTLRGL